jgi:hypothetical protein
MSEKRHTAGISRRTIVKGAAWSVPIIAAAAAVPAHAASTTQKAQMSNALYSCNNGTWTFSFTPSAGVNVTGVSLTTEWSTGTVAAVLKGSKGNYEFKPNGSQQHYSTPGGACALDTLKAENTIFSVSLSDGTTETIYAAQYSGPFRANNPQNCGTCA